MKPTRSHRLCSRVKKLCCRLSPVLLACVANASAAPIVPDLSGTWSYTETSLLVLKPEEETLHVTCLLADGVLTISQSGTDISGTLIHYSTDCISSDGAALPPPWTLPYEAHFSGRVTGHGFQIDQVDAPPAAPVHCPKRGSIRVEDDQATDFRTTGRCILDLFPFPFMAKNFGVATRF